MDDRVLQFRVGVVVLATAIITVILIVLFGRFPTFMRQHYTLFVELDEAPGIAVESPVRKSGIPIGRVRAIEFTDAGRVKITAAVESRYPLRKNEHCRITGSLLGGDAALDFTPGKKSQLVDEYYQNEDIIQGQVGPDPLKILADLQADLKGTVASLGDAGVQVARLAQRLDNLLAETDPAQVKLLAKKSEKTLDSVAEIAGTLQNILGDPKLQADLRQALAEMPALLAATSTAMQGVQESTELAKTNLRNLEGFTEPLRDRGPGIIATVDQAVGRLDEALIQVQIFVKQINSSEGTVGQLLHNPDLYNNVDATVRRIEQLSRQLRPILIDVRAFTDKIAREPGRLGVRGALQKPIGIK